jgi:3-phenylpropionate/trans-cinnamate dioxygenase ferredoxin reductase subunit
VVARVLLEQLILVGPFGAVAAGWFDERLRARGVRVHPKRTVESIEPVDDELEVRLDDGTTFRVDQVCVGVGVAPNVGLAMQAGFELAERGVAVDRSLRTSAADVYAVGDIAAYDSVLHGRRIRIEHWAVARDHGVHVGRQIASGTDSDFSQLPYFFGTMGDWAFLEYVGIGTGRAVVRGSLDGDDMSIAYLDDDDVLVGLITVGRADDLAAARTLVPAGARLDPTLVADADRALEETVQR